MIVSRERVVEEMGEALLKGRAYSEAVESVAAKLGLPEEAVLDAELSRGRAVAVLIDPLTGEANGPHCCGGLETCDVREYCGASDL